MYQWMWLSVHPVNWCIPLMHVHVLYYLCRLYNFVHALAGKWRWSAGGGADLF